MWAVVVTCWHQFEDCCKVTGLMWRWHTVCNTIEINSSFFSNVLVAGSFQLWCQLTQVDCLVAVKQLSLLLFLNSQAVVCCKLVVISHKGALLLFRWSKKQVNNWLFYGHNIHQLGCLIFVCQLFSSWTCVSPCLIGCHLSPSSYRRKPLGTVDAGISMLVALTVTPISHVGALVNKKPTEWWDSAHAIHCPKLHFFLN